MLLEEIERYAITAGIMRITSEVSLTARPFFEKKGYIVKEEQKRKANQLSLTNFWMAREMAKIKPYNGRIPACGVFCGGCPIYTREKRACRGAELNHSRCEKCKTFHLCCFGKKITHIVSNAATSHVPDLKDLPNVGKSMDRILLKIKNC